MVEDAFKFLVLMQIFFLTLIICCLGFGFTNNFSDKTENASFVQIASLFGGAMNVMIHLFVYCTASETLLDQSYRFSDALYCSNWYLLSPKCRKDIVLVMIGSKEPLQLSAGKILNLSLNTYINVLKSCGSYLSVLLAVSE